jgi:AraC-like DNA-binding protein
MGKKPSRIIKTDTAYINIPAGCRERFLTPPSPQIQYLSKQNIVMAGISNLVKGYHLDRLNTWHHLVLFTIAGSGMLKIEDGPTRTLKAGDVFIAPVGSSYSYWTDTKWDIVWLHMAANSKWDKFIWGVSQARKASWLQELQREMEGYIGETNRRRVDSAVALHCYVDLIIFYLQRELGETSPDIAEIRRKLEWVWNEIQKNIKHNWKVSEISALAGMSRSCFHRNVMMTSGMSPKQMLDTMRMERASQMLLYTTYTLTMIADEVGYENQFSFSKAFKRHIGISPAEFRMEQSNKQD